jgi:hypothetical protein
MQLERKEYWRWTDTEPPEAEAELWRRTLEAYEPRGAVVERGALCSDCGREAEVLLYEMDIGTEAEMRAAARRLIAEARERVDKDTTSRCGDHRLVWAIMP